MFQSYVSWRIIWIIHIMYLEQHLTHVSVQWMSALIISILEMGRVGFKEMTWLGQHPRTTHRGAGAQPLAFQNPILDSGIARRRKRASAVPYSTPSGGGIDNSMNKPPDCDARDLGPSLGPTIHSLADLPALSPPLGPHACLPENVIVNNINPYLVYFTLLLYEPTD